MQMKSESNKLMEIFRIIFTGKLKRFHFDNLKFPVFGLSDETALFRLMNFDLQLDSLLADY